MKKHFLYSGEGKKYLEDNYINGDQSTYEIADKWKTYPNFIKRTLLHHNLKLKTKSECQKIALQKGRKVHPTKDKKMPILTKIKISSSLREWWKNLSNEEYQKKQQEAIERWNNFSEEYKKEFRKKASVAILNAANQGSKFERYLITSLQAANFRAQYHRTHLIGKSAFEIDIFLPIEGIAIEIDGPSHIYPIWGEEKLQKTIKADREKNGILLTNGCIVIRIKNYEDYLSIARMREFTAGLISFLRDLIVNLPEKLEDRYIELHIKEESIGRTKETN